MIKEIKLCKNGCNRTVYRDRLICKQCVNEQNRLNWHKNKKYYRKPKPKHTVSCKLCGKEFETARDNQVFCCDQHMHKWHYNQRDLNDKSREKAILKVHDKGKKRIGGKFYTLKEINFIKRNIDNLNGVEIAKKLDRPVRGVRAKIRELKCE